MRNSPPQQLQGGNRGWTCQFYGPTGKALRGDLEIWGSTPDFVQNWYAERMRDASVVCDDRPLNDLRLGSHQLRQMFLHEISSQAHRLVRGRLRAKDSE